jgi:hypothetical protein
MENRSIITYKTLCEVELSLRTSAIMSDYSFLGRSQELRCSVDNKDIKIALDLPMGNESGSETDDSEDDRLSMYAHTRGLN